MVAVEILRGTKKNLIDLLYGRGRDEFAGYPQILLGKRFPLFRVFLAGFPLEKPTIAFLYFYLLITRVYLLKNHPQLRWSANKNIYQLKEGEN